MKLDSKLHMLFAGILVVTSSFAFADNEIGTLPNDPLEIGGLNPFPPPPPEPNWDENQDGWQDLIDSIFTVIDLKDDLEMQIEQLKFEIDNAYMEKNKIIESRTRLLDALDKLEGHVDPMSWMMRMDLEIMIEMELQNFEYYRELIMHLEVSLEIYQAELDALQ